MTVEALVLWKVLVNRFLISDKDGEVSGLFTEDRIYQASDVSVHVLMVRGQR